MAPLKWGPSSGYPSPCLSGRGPLTDRGSPGTGRVIFLKTSLLIGLACPVEGSLSDGVARRQRTAFGWPLRTAPSFIALSQEAGRRWKGPNRLSVDLNTQQLSLSNEGVWKEKVWIAPNPVSCLATFPFSKVANNWCKAETCWHTRRESAYIFATFNKEEKKGSFVSCVFAVTLQELYRLMAPNIISETLKTSTVQ